MKKFTGKINLVIGNMFSGKTTKVSTEIKKYKYVKKNKKKTIILKWDKDFRDKETESNGKTHDGLEFKCVRIPNVLTKDRKIVKELSFVKEYDIVGIDEGHFFPKKDDLVTFCEILANEYSIIVWVAALDGDFNRKPFMEVLKLIPKCERVIRYQSICECGEEAPFTYKLKGDKTKIIDVGGELKYGPRCRKCYFKK